MISPTSSQRLRIAPDVARHLSDVHISLLTEAFTNDDLIYVRSAFVSGYSGAVVLLVSAGPHHPPAVVKLANPQELMREYEAYQEHVRRISPQDIAHIQGEPLVAPDGQLGLIQYTFVGGHASSPAVSLAEYYTSHDASAMSDVLNRVFRVFGRHWWANNRPQVYVLSEQYDRLLSSHLQMARMAHLPGEPQVLEAGQAGVLSLRTVAVGQPVRLVNFEVAKTEAGGTQLTLHAAPPSTEASAPLRIKVDSTEPVAYQPGDRVKQVDGVVIATRQTTLNGIVRTFLPTYQPDEQLLTGGYAEDALDQHGIQLQNPLFEFDSLLDHVMETRSSVIHGDLNLQNILVDSETGFAWLIDFADTRVGPTVMDLQRLEVQIITKLLPSAVLASGLGANAIVDIMVALHRDPPQQNAPHAGLAEPYSVLVTVRRLTRQYLVDDLDWDEYYLGLIVALVGALKYAELDELARSLAFHGAATARGLLGQRLTHQGESSGEAAAGAAAGAAAPEPSTLPPEPEFFVGREEELRFYSEQIQSSGLATITGMTGVGKTALAATLATRLAAPEKTFWYSFGPGEGLDGLLWKLAGFLYWNEQPELWQMLREVQMTGGQPPPVNVLFDYVVRMLPGREYLLCLDDLHIVGEDPLLDQIMKQFHALTKAGELSLLLVSQKLLTFSGPVVQKPLGGLSYDDMRQQLAAWNVATDEAFLRDLHTYTGGNALFLGIAINALANESDPEELLEYLRTSDVLETTLFERLDAALTEQERDIESAVAVLGVPCTRHQIEVTLDAGNLRRPLHDLRRRHLLRSQRSDSEREYFQNAIVRNFYYDQPSRDARRQMHFRAAELFELEERAILRAAQHYEKAQAYSKSVELATENVPLLIGRFQARRLAELLAQFDEEHLSEEEWIAVNAALGQVYAFLGERPRAESCYETTISHLEWMDDSQEVSELRTRVLRGMGQLHYNEAPEQAVEWLQRAFDELARYEGNSDPEIEAGLYIDMGWAQRRLHNMPEAMEALEQGIERLPRGPSQLRGDALTRMATLYAAQYDLENAQRYAQLAVRNSRRLRDVWHEQTVLAMLGTIKHSGCDWRGASAEYEKALALSVRIGDRAVQAALEVNLGVAHTNLDNTESALEHLRNGLNLSQQSQLQNYELKAQLAIAKLYTRLGDWEHAENHLVTAEELVEKSETADSQFHLPLILSAWAEMELAMGNTEEALSYADESVELAIEQNKQVDRAICQRVKSQVLMANGQYQEAATLLEESLLLLEGRHGYEEAKIKALLGQALHKTGDTARRDELIEEALSMFDACGAKYDLAELAQEAGAQTEHSV